jgi:hypothetical protein
MRARALLNPNLRISEIAYDVGFQSLTQFNRTFQRVFGQSPIRVSRRAQSCLSLTRIRSSIAMKKLNHSKNSGSDRFFERSIRAITTRKTLPGDFDQASVWSMSITLEYPTEFLVPLRPSGLANAFLRGGAEGG